GHRIAQHESAVWTQDAMHLGERATELRVAKDVEEAVLRRDADARIVDRESERVPVADVDELLTEPPVHARRGDEIPPGSRPHLRDGLDADDGAGPSAEVRELQELEAATDTHVQDGRLVHEIPRMDRRAAAVVHLEHPRRNDELGRRPDGIRRAAEPWVRREADLALEVV